MLLFAVFDDQGPAKEWPLRHAYLVGPDDMVIAGDVRFERGLVRCERRGADGACALGVQFPVASIEGVGPAGATPGASLITLRTCLLPQRAAPYLLSLELARHRLMLVLNKLEEWAFFDLPADDPLMKLVEETRQAFTRALLLQKTGGGAGGQWYTAEADQAARQALALGVAASEALARRQAQMQHERRVSGELARAAALNPPANAITDFEARASRAAVMGSPGVLLPEAPRIGCAITPGAFGPGVQDAVSNACDVLVAPMRWVDMEPTEGKYAFAPTDRWIEWAVTKAKLPVIAGPLIDFRAAAVPDFLYIWEHDYETLRDVVVEHVKNLVTRYRRTVHTWVVCSSLPCGGTLPLNYEQVIDLTRTCVLLTRKLQPSAKVAVDLAQPWGEYAASGQGGGGGGGGGSMKAIPPVLYAELLNQLGMNLDALSVRIQMGQAAGGRSTRDLMAVSSLLDRIAALDRPLIVTLGAPSAGATTGSGVPAGGGAGAGGGGAEPGYWHRPWSPEAQAAWLQSVGAMVAGKPYVQSIAWQQLLDDPQGEMPSGGLMAANGQAKPVWATLKRLRDGLRSGAASLY
jgi:hypothetical protein